MLTDYGRQATPKKTGLARGPEEFRNLRLGYSFIPQGNTGEPLLSLSMSMAAFKKANQGARKQLERHEKLEITALQVV